MELTVGEVGPLPLSEMNGRPATGLRLGLIWIGDALEATARPSMSPVRQCKRSRSPTKQFTAAFLQGVCEVSGKWIAQLSVC